MLILIGILSLLLQATSVVICYKLYGLLAKTPATGAEAWGRMTPMPGPTAGTESSSPMDLPEGYGPTEVEIEPGMYDQTDHVFLRSQG